MIELTPAQLAHLDQVIATNKPLVDQLVQWAAEDIGNHGADKTMLIIANNMRQTDIEKLASVTAVALVRLAELQIASQDTENRT